jgi:hypothetical protein
MILLILLSSVRRLCGRKLIIEEKSHPQSDPVIGDLPVFHNYLLTFDPCTFNVFQRLGSSFDTQLDGMLEAFGDDAIISVVFATDIFPP